MFGKRLKEERSKLNIKQPILADICGASKRTVVDWEQDKTTPKAKQLMAMAEHGLDVNYLLTGKRTQPVELPSDEAFLLDSFRALNNEQKKMALQFLMGGFGGLQDKGVEKSHNTGVVNSPHAVVSNSFNNQSGMSEYGFTMIAVVFAVATLFMAQLTGYFVVTDISLGFVCAMMATVFCVGNLSFVVCAHEARKNLLLKKEGI